MRTERHIPEIKVPAVPVSTRDILQDYNYIWPVVVKPTGFFGLGRPIYLGNHDGVSQVEPGLKVLQLKRGKKPTLLWADAEPPYDKIVNGHLVEEVKVTLEEPPKDEEPFDLDS